MSHKRESRLSVLYPGERQDVEVFVSCRDLKSPDFFRAINPAVSLYIQRNGEFELNDQTERIRASPNPDFKKAFALEFFFAVRQELKFVVTDSTAEGLEKPVGEIVTSLGQIMGHPHQTITFDVKKDAEKNIGHMGKLTIRAERLNYSSDLARMTMKARQLKVSKGLFSKPSYEYSLRLYRFLGNAGYGLVFESEIRKNENPRWSEIQIKFLKLANGDYDRKVKAEVINYTSPGHAVVHGECYFTVNDLLSNEALDYEIDLINPKNNQKYGVLVVDSFDLIEKPHFLEYIQAGLQFNVMIGLDYTSSNGDPFATDSLHTIVNEKEMNQYQKAISGVCEILLNYDHDKKVLMYGFGGIPNYQQFKSELTSHCFPLTGSTVNPWADNMDGIMSVYKNSFKNITFASPTYFEPIFRQAMQIAKNNLETNSNEYTILLMLTDGKCHDMQDTINAIIESAYLPLSIIIVGVGTADWKRMEILDGDDGLINHKGEQAIRDLVQFVPFASFENNPDLLAKNVLAEVPAQVVSYMLSQGIKPKNLASMGESRKEADKERERIKEKEKYVSQVTGLIDDDLGDEGKDASFQHTPSWIENSVDHFSKALEFMKRENNNLFVNYTRECNNSKANFQTGAYRTIDSYTTPKVGINVINANMLSGDNNDANISVEYQKLNKVAQ